MPWRRFESSLRTGARIFEKLIEQRNQQITTAAAILSRDHAFQEAFAGADQDRETTLSALASLRGRVRADAVLIASLDKELLFDTRRPQLHSVPFPFPKLIEKAETNDCHLRVCCARPRTLRHRGRAVTRARSHCVALSNVPHRRRFRA